MVANPYEIWETMQYKFVGIIDSFISLKIRRLEIRKKGSARLPK